MNSNLFYLDDYSSVFIFLTIKQGCLMKNKVKLRKVHKYSLIFFSCATFPKVTVVACWCLLLKQFAAVRTNFSDMRDPLHKYSCVSSDFALTT